MDVMVVLGYNKGYVGVLSRKGFQPQGGCNQLS